MWRISESVFQFRTSEGQFLTCNGDGDSVTATAESPSDSETFYLERNFNNRIHIKLKSGTYIQVLAHFLHFCIWQKHFLQLQTSFDNTSSFFFISLSVSIVGYIKHIWYKKILCLFRGLYNIYMSEGSKTYLKYLGFLSFIPELSGVRISYLTIKTTLQLSIVPKTHWMMVIFQVGKGNNGLLRCVLINSLWSFR